MVLLACLRPAGTQTEDGGESGRTALPGTAALGGLPGLILQEP